MDQHKYQERMDVFNKIEELRKENKLGGLNGGQLQEIIIQSEMNEKAIYAMSQFFLNDRAVILHDEALLVGVGKILDALSRDMEHVRKEMMEPYEGE